MRNFCHSCKYCTLNRSVTKTNPSVDNRLWSTPQKRFEYVSKTSWERVNKNSLTLLYVLKKSWWRLQNLLKTSWRCLEDIFARCLEDVLKTSWKRLEDILKMSWRRFCKASWRCFEDVLASSLEDVLKMSWRHLEDVLKTSSTCIEDIWLRQIYSSWSRRLEDVFWSRRRKTSSRRLH